MAEQTERQAQINQATQELKRQIVIFLDKSIQNQTDLQQSLSQLPQRRSRTSSEDEPQKKRPCPSPPNLVQGQKRDAEEGLMKLWAKENGITLDQLQEFLRDQPQIDYSYKSMNEDGKLDDTSFKKLPQINYNHNMKEQCCLICINNFDPDERVTILPCFHTFHKECTKQWLSKKAECPVCKINI